MIPLRDINRSTRFPVFVVVLIVLNGLVWFYELSLGHQLRKFFFLFGVVPSFYFDPDYWQTTGLIVGVLPLFTSMFLHGGWLHFLGNMLYLWVFGDNVEDRLGHFRFLVFYLVCGLAAAALHIVTNSASRVPTVFFFQLMELPAIIFIGIWFIIQFFSGAFSLTISSGGNLGGTAYWAHIGGFAAGIILVLRHQRRARRFYTM